MSTPADPADPTAWALPLLRRLLPPDLFDDASLRQTLAHAATLGPAEAAAHWRGLLGDGEGDVRVREFVEGWGARGRGGRGRGRGRGRGGRGGRAGRNTGRGAGGAGGRIEGTGTMTPTTTGTMTPTTTGTMTPTTGMMTPTTGMMTPTTGTMTPTTGMMTPTTGMMTPTTGTMTPTTGTMTPTTGTMTPTTTGTMTPTTTRGRAAKNKATARVAGGTAMHGALSALADLDAAICTLEASTQSTDATDRAARHCDCMATRHALLAAAPNCLHCGHIVCVRQGLGPCTVCGRALLDGAQTAGVLAALRGERDAEARARATQHRDRLLGFQETNARRAVVRDEAAAFDDGAGDVWASAAVRAERLRTQQKVLREARWKAQPAGLRRKVVVEIDVVGGRVLRRMQEVGVEEGGDSEGEDPEEDPEEVDEGERAPGWNPLRGRLVRPRAREGGEGGERREVRLWRRVQGDEEGE